MVQNLKIAESGIFVNIVCLLKQWLKFFEAASSLILATSRPCLVVPFSTHLTKMPSSVFYKKVIKAKCRNLKTLIFVFIFVLCLALLQLSRESGE